MIKKLEKVFLIVILISVFILAYNWYENYLFKNSEISDEYKELIFSKEQEVLHLMQKNYGFSFKVPLIVTDKFKGRLYGVTSYNNGEIKIYLNKKVMKESMEYMVESVIAHEYAHALMFKLGHYGSNGDGHSSKWKEACVNLGGKNCEQYVNSEDVVMGKMPF
ncbi:MAG: SprT-like domain-containing protein [Sulfurimonas sp.]|uniref:SprT-like domain-containing protein n=1 Tax=Sulfurimonas sp. TaxID=2022749 RepID=UPI002633A8F4|nr:SprT-like domain-containing protein [Sulfurimonas sp.]MCW8894368.1 SprT-like domain-containing protein [Sulfurimonas sp.]MCW8954272.1 SprT-like domain-containing protein [Sulfurimonas sp.]MCW9066946.1 SprT-like domain-containing protein [Sulfurimonas sp.]